MDTVGTFTTETGNGNATAGSGGTGRGVAIVIVTYESDPQLLQRCLASTIAEWHLSVGSNVPILDVLVVDNRSPTLAPATQRLVEALATETPSTEAPSVETATATAAVCPVPLRFADLGRNYGFAGAVNRAVRRLPPNIDLVFLLNPDAELEPGAVMKCAAVLRALPPTTVSAAPKMLLMTAVGVPHVPTVDPAESTVASAAAPTIDAIANAVNARGEAFNIGLGQPDIGQYDAPAACFGPCFGAALLRRTAFDSDQVGELDESLFLYYEDVDWNWRAQILGFDSVTVPSARVHHVMSASTRDRPYDFKFRLTERNLLLVALVCIPGSEAFVVTGHRMLGLLRGSVRGHYRVAGLRAVCGVVWRWRRTLRRRRDLQGKRRRAHADILVYGIGEQTFFDAVRYKPTRPAEALAFAERRRADGRAEETRFG